MLRKRVRTENSLKRELIREVLAIEQDITAGLEKLLKEVQSVT